MEREYDTVIAVRCDRVADEDLGSRVLSHLESDHELSVQVAFQDLQDSTIGIAAAVKATNAREALGTTLEGLCAALEIRPSDLCDDDFVELKAEPFVDPSENEYVSQAEIARRLRISRARVHQLAKRSDFPAPVQPNGRRGSLYRWGEIREWQERRAKSRESSGKPAMRKRAA